MQNSISAKNYPAIFTKRKTFFMAYFEGPYLRVLSPRTEDGISLLTDEQGRVVHKETFLPITAQRELEAQNVKLPKHLRKKIEVVGSATSQQKKAQPAQTSQQLAEIADVQKASNPTNSTNAQQPAQNIANTNPNTPSISGTQSDAENTVAKNTAAANKKAAAQKVAAQPTKVEGAYGTTENDDDDDDEE